MTARADYRSVACPRCGAEVGELCRRLLAGRFDHIDGPHVSRRRLADEWCPLCGGLLDDPYHEEKCSAKAAALAMRLEADLNERDQYTADNPPPWINRHRRA